MRAEQRRTVTFLALLATPLLMHSDAVCLPSSECTLLARIKVFIHQNTQVLLGRAVLNEFFYQCVYLHEIALTQVLALGLVEPH